MTQQVRNNYQCLDCKIDMVCPRCKKNRPMGTPFSLWLRRLPFPLNSNNYYNTDLDYIWFAYKQGWFITLEEKQSGHTVNQFQKEVLSIIENRLSLILTQDQITIRGKRPITYNGHYNIIFEHTSPSDSEWVIINGKSCTVDNLYHLLKYGELSNDKGHRINCDLDIETDNFRAIAIDLDYLIELAMDAQRIATNPKKREVDLTFFAGSIGVIIEELHRLKNIW